MFVPPEFSQVNIRESQFEQQKVKNYCFPLDAVHYTVVTFSSQWGCVQTKDTLLFFFHKNSRSCVCYDNKDNAEDICSKDKKERFSSLQD